MARPTKILTEQQLQSIEMMAGLGLRQDDIARLNGVSVDTLKKYAENALKTGKAKANLQVGQSLFKKATQGENVSAMIFWLKTQAGWREPDPAPPPWIAHLIPRPPV